MSPAALAETAFYELMTSAMNAGGISSFFVQKEDFFVMLWSLAVVFLGGLLGGELFRRLRLPPLLGMLLVGIAVGPYALGLLDESLLAISDDL